MSLLDLFIILGAVLLYMALHFPLVYMIVGTLLVLIVVRWFNGERFAKRPSP